jgi:deoxyadenosine/deoxycytidine kinase
MNKFIVVAGNIGAGKSTLVEMLCDRLEWEPYYEPVADNPYLSDFYGDMQAWSFQSQVFFLTNRLKTHRALMRHPGSVIQDRSVYEDAEVFAENLYRQGSMSDRDYQTYRDLYQVLTAFLPAPDLVIYLRASPETLVKRIAQRGRDFENDMPPAYLAQLNTLYEGWIDGLSFCPVLTVPADNLDFVARSGHFDLILEKVSEKLAGKEEVVFQFDEFSPTD